MIKKELYRIDLGYSFIWDRAEVWFYRYDMPMKFFVLDAHRYNRIMECLRESTKDPVGLAGFGRFGIVYEVE